MNESPDSMKSVSTSASSRGDEVLPEEAGEPKEVECKHCKMPIEISTWEPRRCIHIKDGLKECDGEFHHNCLHEHNYIYHETQHVYIGEVEELKEQLERASRHDGRRIRGDRGVGAS